MQGLVNDVINGSQEAKENARKFLLEVINDLRSDLHNNNDLNKLTGLKDAINNIATGNYKNIPGYNLENTKHFLQDEGNMLEFWASKKSIAESSGKNVTDFLSSAAQNVRARNKWTKLVYGLLIGTTALSALVIATMGRKNYFNKDLYEKKDTPGAVK